MVPVMSKAENDEDRAETERLLEPARTEEIFSGEDWEKNCMTRLGSDRRKFSGTCKAK